MSLQRHLLRALHILPSQLGSEVTEVIQQLKDMFPTLLKTIMMGCDDILQAVVVHEVVHVHQSTSVGRSKHDASTSEEYRC
jgi:predicted SprT family Zn-dependent metalloprotease